MRYTKRWIILVSVLTLAGASILWISVHCNKTVEQSQGYAIIHRAYFSDANFFNRAYEKNTPVYPDNNIVAGIVPHHLLASHLIAEFFQGLHHETFETIVVIGPDHEHRSFFRVTTSEGAWETPFGIVAPDIARIAMLKQSGLVGVDESVFSIEHSITAQVAFIKKSFPDAKIIPLILQSTVSQTESEHIAQRLKEVLPKNSLVIASVDFAHDVTEAEAQKQNNEHVRLLRLLDVAQVPNMHLDSIPSIQTVISYARAAGVKTPQLLRNSNTFEVTQQNTFSTGTSYITMYFGK